MVVRSGQLKTLGTINATNAADTAHPNDTTPSSYLSTSLRQHGHPSARSRDAWITVANGAADVGCSVTVALYGSLNGTTWYAIGTLNAAAPIVPGTLTVLTHTNRLAYAEAAPGILGWPHLWASVTGTLAQTTTVAALGEEQ